MAGYSSLNLDDIPARRDPDTGADWLTLRHLLGVAAFGLNAWRAPDAGGTVIERHNEEDSAHQEVYLVVAGDATFTVDGDTIAAPAGTIVFVEDYTLDREATANTPGTTVLAIGAEQGRIFTPSTWETDLITAD